MSCIYIGGSRAIISASTEKAIEHLKTASMRTKGAAKVADDEARKREILKEEFKKSPRIRNKERLRNVNARFEAEGFKSIGEKTLSRMKSKLILDTL